MRTRPTDLDDHELTAALRQEWDADIGADALEYVAIGGGTHHWRAGRFWLGVDDLDEKPFLGASRSEVFANLRSRLEVARTVRDSGLDFVVAPLDSRTCDVLVSVSARYALAVYRFLPGTTYRFAEPLPVSEREELLDLLVRLHQATPLPAHLAREVPIGLARRQDFEDALRHVHEPWCSGPFAESARGILAQRLAQVQELFDAFDALVREVTAVGATLVLTHGEPHPANLMALDGSLKLLDWDTVGLALPERDLWWLAKDRATDMRTYQHHTKRRVDARAIALYRVRWQLDDLIWCITALRAPHTDTVDTRLALASLSKCAEVPAWMS